MALLIAKPALMKQKFNYCFIFSLLYNKFMKTRVLIPTHDADARIDQVLASLPAQLVEPIILANGPHEDNVIAKKSANAYNVPFFEYQQQGKLVALQQYMANLAIQDALEPTIILDDDAVPVFPAAWHNKLRKLLLQLPCPTSVGGPMIYTQCSPIDMLMRSTRRAAIGGLTHRRMQYGPNMAIKLFNEKTLNAFLAMPHYWPGEDAAIADVIVANNGQHLQTVNPLAVVTAPLSESAVPWQYRLRFGAEETRNMVTNNYTQRAATGAVPYRTSKKMASHNTTPV